MRAMGLLVYCTTIQEAEDILEAIFVVAIENMMEPF